MEKILAFLLIVILLATVTPVFAEAVLSQNENSERKDGSALEPYPTTIPKVCLSKYKTKGFYIPPVSDHGSLDITKLYISAADNNSIIEVNGYPTV